MGGGKRCLLGSSDLTAALFKTLIMELGKFNFIFLYTFQFCSPNFLEPHKLYFDFANSVVNRKSMLLMVKAASTASLPFKHVVFFFSENVLQDKESIPNEKYSSVFSRNCWRSEHSHFTVPVAQEFNFLKNC